MDITYYGHSFFRIRGREGTVVTDPYQPTMGYPLPSVNANICTISHEHPGHNNAGAIANDPYVAAGPGEYEVSNIFVFGRITYHDRQKGTRLGRNTIYVIEMEDLHVAHLGDLGHLPDQATVEFLGDVDILLIPVGGDVTLTASMASEVINMIEPRLVIPMHYHTPEYAGPAQLDPVSKFLKEMGVQSHPTSDTLRVSKTSLPTETQIVVLKYPGQKDDH